MSQAGDCKQHVAISLEDLIPRDNFSREVEQSIDLSFVRDLVRTESLGVGDDAHDLRFQRAQSKKAVFCGIKILGV